MNNISPGKVLRNCLRPWALAVLWLSLAPMAMAADLPADDPAPLEFFAKGDAFIDFDMSPDGGHIALVRMVDDRPVVRMMKFDGAGIEEVALFPLPPSLFGWVNWVDDTRLLVGYTLISFDRRGAPRTIREITLIDVAGGTSRKLLSYPLNIYMANGADDFLSALRDDTGHALISYPLDGGFYPAVWKLDLNDGSTEEIEPARDAVDEWFVDKEGNVRIGMGWGEDGMVLYLRPSVDADWQELHGHPLFQDGYFTPVSFDLKGEIFFIISSVGKGRQAIYSFDVKTMSITEKVFQHSEYDAGGLLMTPDGKPLAASYVADKVELAYLDDDFRALHAKINAHLQGRSNLPLGMNREGQIMLVYSSNEKTPGGIYLYDHEEDAIFLVAEQNPTIDPEQMATMRRIDYFSRDGLKISGYLTLPPGGKQANLPAIIMPHGGPWVRDYLSFDYWVQFLASRGYAVLQPNFRGSTGFGVYFLAHGFGEWGKAMQRDVDDAAAWLVSEGFADPDRICIVGGSYGGYAALMGAITGQDLYRCAVAFAPVADLPQYLKYISRTPGGDNVISRIVGDKGRRAGKSVSPLHLARKTAIPVLLAHGSHDIRVPYDHSERMARALRKKHKTHELLTLDSGSHMLMQERHRLIFLARLEKFLGQYIGAAETAH